MVFMLGRNGVAEDVRVELEHVRAVRADGGDVAALFAAFGGDEVLGGEKGGRGGGAKEYGVGFADVVFEQALVVTIFGADDAELEFWVCAADVLPVGGGVIFVHYAFRTGEGTVDEVNVVDFVFS